jgi:hypothetical protein
MAEKSEGGKPSDFFVGVVDLFAVLLPGAALTLFLERALSQSKLLTELLNDLPGGVARWAVFLVASYILGHFIFAVGSFFLDDLYDVSYKKWFERRKKVYDLRTEVKKHLKGWTRDGGNEKTRPQPVRALPEELIDADVFNLATSFVRVQSSPAAVEIDRAEADSKLFRSLTILQLVSWPLLVPSKGRYWWISYATLVVLLLLTKIHRIKRVDDVLKQDSMKGWGLSLLLTIPLAVLAACVSWTAFHALPDIPWLVGYIVLFLSVWRFMDTRMKRTKLTYEFCAVLGAMPKRPPDTHEASA